ncbi:helix-turn-helix domain-containing protein [Candidatus Woesearchaeota archaeon]|nr:helix-turn-helix domain-containing protein [Candidatus Woesearchaeota archaeon]
MAEESFMLLSLKEQESKRLAQVIGNETCRAILDYLTGKEYATETQVAEEMDIPLSTVHYNLRALRQSGLIVADEYHYSGKGKEVPHYKLAKKYIIIAPREENSLKDKLRRFLPLTTVAIGLAAVVEFGSRLLRNGWLGTRDAGTVEALKTTTAPETARMATQEAVPVVLQEVSRQPFPSPLALWFLAGALCIILTLAVWEWVRK